MEEYSNDNNILLGSILIDSYLSSADDKMDFFHIDWVLFGNYWESDEMPWLETALTRLGFTVIYPSDEEIEGYLGDSKDVYVRVIINWERLNMEYLKEVLQPFEKWENSEERTDFQRNKKKIDAIKVWTYLLMWARNIVDIDSRGCYPSFALSNLCASSFEFESVRLESMEGFLQSLKTSDALLQKQIQSLSHKEAKNAGEALKESFGGRHLHWQGQTIDRFSEEYQQLLKRVFRAKWEQDADFREALLATKGKTLIHSIGKQNQEDTILTEKEFIEVLEYLRGLL